MTADTKAAALAAKLDHHNRWRRGHEEYAMDDPTELGVTIDAAAALLRTQAARIAELEAERAGLVAAERERCAALCSKAMPQPVANWSDAQIVEALRLVREAILNTEAKP